MVLGNSFLYITLNDDHAATVFAVIRGLARGVWQGRGAGEHDLDSHGAAVEAVPVGGHPGPSSSAELEGNYAGTNIFLLYVHFILITKFYKITFIHFILLLFFSVMWPTRLRRPCRSFSVPAAVLVPATSLPRPRCCC